MSNGAITDHAGEEIMPIAAVAPRLTDQGAANPANRRYLAAMTATANDVAAALRDRLPGLTVRKLHALLYFCQGIHFAANNTPLFPDAITATAHGVLVAAVTDDPDRPLGDAQHVVVGVTAARYGSLPAMDLEALIRGQRPWGITPTGGTVSTDHIRAWFRAQDDDPEGTVSGFPRSQRGRPDTTTARPADPDDPAKIAAFAAEMRSRM